MRAFSLLLVFPLSLCAQELVPNGDFETYTQCPDYVSQIDRAAGWSRPTEGTSDYFNGCLGAPFSMNVPDNQFGLEPAHSGNGYAGLYCFYANSEANVPGETSREYVTHALASPLVPGETYAVEFYVSLADVSKYAVNDIGALLSVQPPTRNDDLTITANPQVRNTSQTLLNNKNGWTRISGCVVADAAFAYITIGNFHEGSAIVFEEVPTNNPLLYFSYYFVDDVSVQHLEPPQLGPDVSTCDPVELSVQNPVTGATYTWNTGETGTTIIAGSAGTYTVSLVTDACVLSDTVVVDLAQPLVLSLVPDTTVNLCMSPVFDLGPDSLPPDATVIWNTGATTATLPISEPGTYTVTVSASGYCSAFATTHVHDACTNPVYAPNAFTPNGDGINDHWQPVWVANPNATLELTIYDRWGHALFTAHDSAFAWDGTADGTLVPTGIYAWRGRARDPETGMDMLLKGSIDLVR